MNQPQQSRSLRTSIVIPIVILISLVALAVGLLVNNYLNQQMISDMQRRAELLTYSVKYIAQIAGDSPELNRTVHALGTEEDINSIYVALMDSGKIIASNKFRHKNNFISDIDENKFHHSLLSQFSSQFNNDISVVDPNNSSVIYASRVLINSAEQEDAFIKAVVFVDLDTQRSSAQIAKKMQTLLIIISTTVAAIITLIILLLNIYLFIPMCSILKVVKQRANGDTNAYARIFRHDEIGVLASTLNDLMQVEEENTKAVKEREQELQLIFDNAPIHIWYKDDKNTLLRLNKSAARLIGKPVNEIEGKSLSEFFPVSAENELNDDQLIIRSGTSSLNIIEKHVVDGQQYWIKTDKVPYKPLDQSKQRILVLKQDITHLKQIEEKLRESEQRFQLVIEATYDGIWDWPDITKDDEYWSPQWKALLGYEEHEIEASAKTFFSMLHPNDIQTVEAAVKVHQEQGIPFDVEYRLKNKEGEYRWFQAKGIMSKNEDTGTQRMTGSISDIQQRKESERKLQDYNAELKRSNAVLDEYAYAASHDLQSPLRGIDQIASWIIEDLADGNTENITANLTLMRGRVQRMEKLLKDLLVYSKVGRQEEAMGDVNTEVLVSDVFKLAAPPAKFQLAIENELPTFVTLVAPLEQVFRNLIGNAIKHHDKDNAVISVGCSVLKEESRYQFYVKDDGPGIDKKYHELVFKLFKSLKSRDEVEASGIGLTLVSKIITTYKGSIRLESELGSGTTFYFTWPINIDTLEIVEL